MARIRTVKPEFNTSASVARLSESAQLFMVKLLTEADDYGRLLWLPKKLAGDLYPHRDDIDGKRINQLAKELEKEGILQRYEVDSKAYACFPNWEKHQRVDRPSKSTIPPQPSRDTREPLAESSRPEEEKEREEEKEGEGDNAAVAATSTPREECLDESKPTPEDFLTAWNESVPFSRIERMTDKRQTALRARRADDSWRRDWRKALAKVRGSPFLRGENDRNWKADVDFFLRPDSVTRILEGKYDASGKHRQGDGRVATDAGTIAKIRYFDPAKAATGKSSEDSDERSASA